MLTVIIPARNEAGNLPILLTRLRQILRPLEGEIIVVDDHSSDRTGDLVRQMANASWGKDRYLRCVPNQEAPGYGNAISLGIKLARCPRLTIMAADGSDDQAALGVYAQGRFLSFGDRWQQGRPQGYPVIKRWVNRIGNHLVTDPRRFGFSSYRDWSDPFKAYPTELARECLPLPNNMSAGMALALRAAKQLPYTVIPVQWVDRREHGESKFYPWTSLAYLHTALRERFV